MDFDWCLCRQSKCSRSDPNSIVYLSHRFHSCGVDLAWVKGHYLMGIFMVVLTVLSVDDFNKPLFHPPAMNPPPLLFSPSVLSPCTSFSPSPCLLFWGPIQRTHINSIHSTVRLFQLQRWQGELIFGWGEQIGGWQSSTAIRAAEEAKCVCGCRSTQMTVPGGQQFPSAGASARWSLVHWVWLIWHISDVRWTAHLNTVVPGD